MNNEELIKEIFHCYIGTIRILYSKEPYEFKLNNNKQNEVNLKKE
jgi:hypothetical protein